MILAGDIGGTKTTLALYQKQGHLLQCELKQTYPSSDYARFEDILAVFLPATVLIDAACFGIAGPVVNQCCQATNLPWRVDARELAATLRTARIQLLNDLEAMALGLLQSPDKDLLELNPNAKKQPGNKAVIAAGTGLGEAILYWDGQRHHPIATEGGHCDFAPQTEQQDRLLRYLRQRFQGHVSWERLLSGDGLGCIYDFLIADGEPACPEVERALTDRNAIISGMGLDRKNPVCTQALQLFVQLYGAEAGNLALKCLAQGGLFIGGGIAPKIQPALETGDFLRAFIDKGRFRGLLESLSIRLSLNPETPLTGAASYFFER